MIRFGESVFIVYLSQAGVALKLLSDRYSWFFGQALSSAYPTLCYGKIKAFFSGTFSGSNTQQRQRRERCQVGPARRRYHLETCVTAAFSQATETTVIISRYHVQYTVK